MKPKTTGSLLLALPFLVAACDQSSTGNEDGTEFSEKAFDLLCENIPQYDYSVVCLAEDTLSFIPSAREPGDAACVWTVDKPDLNNPPTNRLALLSLSVVNGLTISSAETSFESQRNVTSMFGTIAEISDLGDDAFFSAAGRTLHVRVGTVHVTLNSVWGQGNGSETCTDVFDGINTMAHTIVDNIVAQSL